MSFWFCGYRSDIRIELQAPVDRGYYMSARFIEFIKGVGDKL